MYCNSMYWVYVYGVYFMYSVYCVYTVCNVYTHVYVYIYCISGNFTQLINCQNMFINIAYLAAILSFKSCDLAIA